MGRIIGENVKNQLILKDPFSGDPIVLYYRIPTSEERIAYESAKYRREKDRFEFCLSEARLKFGEKIIEGFEEGSFLHKVARPASRSEAGEGAPEAGPFSSDPESPNYDPSWKDLLRKYAPDVLEVLAEHAFDSLRTVASQGEFSEKNF